MKIIRITKHNTVRGRLSEKYLTQRFNAWNISYTKYLWLIIIVKLSFFSRTCIIYCIQELTCENERLIENVEVHQFYVAQLNMYDVVIGSAEWMDINIATESWDYNYHRQLRQ